MAVSVTLDFVSNGLATGSVTLPLGLVVGHAHTTGVASVFSWDFQARTFPGGVLLTDGGSFQNARIIGASLVDWFFYRYLWLWTVPPDAAECANDQIQIRTGCIVGT